MKNTIDKCPDCGASPLLINKSKGEIICKECGLVLDDALIQIEKPTVSDKEGDTKKVRGVGPAHSYKYHDQGLGTQIGNYSDMSKLSTKQRWRVSKFKKWHRRAGSALERNLEIALNFIKVYTSKLNLPNRIEEEACRLYTFTAQRGITKGRSIEQTSAAAVYIATRLHRIPLSLSTISETSNITKKELGRTVRVVSKKMKVILKPQEPADYVAKICGTLNLSPQVQTKAVSLIENAFNRKNLSGRGPFGIAAAAIYLSTLLLQEKRTQESIAEAAGITEVTLRNRYQELMELLELGDIKEILKKKKNFI